MVRAQLAFVIAAVAAVIIITLIKLNNFLSNFLLSFPPYDP